MAQSGIYVIENTVSRKVYVGSSVSIPGRLNNHRACLRRGDHENGHLQHSWSKHGESAFRFWVAEECDPAILREREQWWLDMFEPFRERGYNICRDATGTSGFRHSDATKAFISERNTGRRHTPEEIEKISRSQRGRPKSEAFKAKISALSKGRRFSADARARMGRKPGSPRTEADRAADAAKRGRHNPHAARLTPEQVIEIRRRRPGETLKVLAAEYGVSINTIRRAATLEYWRHIA